MKILQRQLMAQAARLRAEADQLEALADDKTPKRAKQAKKLHIFSKSYTLLHFGCNKILPYFFQR
jgi:hypothetical protein